MVCGRGDHSGGIGRKTEEGGVIDIRSCDFPRTAGYTGPNPDFPSNVDPSHSPACSDCHLSHYNCMYQDLQLGHSLTPAFQFPNTADFSVLQEGLLQYTCTLYHPSLNAKQKNLGRSRSRLDLTSNNYRRRLSLFININRSTIPPDPY